MTLTCADSQDFDRFHEECGVFAVYGHADAAALTALGLHALQHRGQEAAGIVSYDGTHFNSHRGQGLVDKVFSDAGLMATLKGHAAIGHNRYATTGGGSLRNIQPLYGDLECGGLALAHNGNLTDTEQRRAELVAEGALFQSTTDTEIILHRIARSGGVGIDDRIAAALRGVSGAYSLVVLADGAVYGVRDPRGFRPLVLGRLGDAFILASETCALDIIGADRVRDIDPGEMVRIDSNGITSRRPFDAAARRFCVFEYIYFARPDSVVEGRSVYAMRQAIGRELAREAPASRADLVIPVPDSGVPAAMGFAAESGLPFEFGIIRNHYVGRTFIQPSQDIRHLGVRLKHNPNSALISGKDIVLVDDSIVRGTTSRKIVEMVRAAGARTVHMRISSPPTTHSCFYGIDTPDQNDLLAYRYDVDAIRSMIGVDSLAYISIDGLYRAIGSMRRDAADHGFCDACFTGDYAVPVDGAKGCQGKRSSQLNETPLGRAK